MRQRAEDTSDRWLGILSGYILRKDPADADMGSRCLYMLIVYFCLISSATPLIYRCYLFIFTSYFILITCPLMSSTSPLSCPLGADTARATRAHRALRIICTLYRARAWEYVPGSTVSIWDYKLYRRIHYDVVLCSVLNYSNVQNTRKKACLQVKVAERNPPWLYNSTHYTTHHNTIH